MVLERKVKTMDCIFCKIINREIPAEIIYENEKVLAFPDVNPQAPRHFLIIPKIHVEKLSDLKTKEEYNYLDDIFAAANQIARLNNFEKDGFRVVVNCGKGAGQAVWHLHFHLLGGRKFHWPPG